MGLTDPHGCPLTLPAAPRSPPAAADFAQRAPFEIKSPSPLPLPLSTRALPRPRWRRRLTPLRSAALRRAPARLRGRPRGRRRHVLPSRAARPRAFRASPPAEDARPRRGEETTPHTHPRSGRDGLPGVKWGERGFSGIAAGWGHRCL